MAKPKGEFTSHDVSSAWNDGYEAAREDFRGGKSTEQHVLVAPHHAGGEFALSLHDDAIRVTYMDEYSVIGVAFSLDDITDLFRTKSQNDERMMNNGEHSSTVHEGEGNQERG